MNLIIPLKAHYEYSQIHMSILKYVLHQDEHEKRELKQQEFLVELINTLNNQYITLGT
jgi:hypothetical protein